MMMVFPAIRTIPIRFGTHAFPDVLKITNAKCLRRSLSGMPTTPMQEELRQDGSTWTQSDLTETIEPYFDCQQPAVIRGAVAMEDAVEKWKDWKHFQRAVKEDTACHVEVGGNYSTSERSDIRFHDFLAYLQFFEERHGRTGPTPPPNKDLVYLAQNDVFEELYRDFHVPELCTTVGNGQLYSTMIWIGPHGCVSPLHSDPLDNVLMQFVGKKRLYLYAPSEQVYAGEEGNQSNTSPINPEEAPDFDRYPAVATLSPALECTLEPGDMVYIPKRFFHFVRTVETSVSVNAWWR